jgi:glycosyltransferase involved in cell wall biosynthesis
MARVCDRVIAGNAHLASLVKRFGGRVAVVPTCVDDQRLTPRRKHRFGGKVVIGWIGSRSTLIYLEGLREVFEEISHRYGASVLLKVVCDAFPAPLGLEVVEKAWRLEDELEDLRSFDIGIMPLSDDVWTRGKCGFKLLQYMAVGVPVVASPVGVNRQIIRHARNGLLADDDKQWIEMLAALIENVALRYNMGRWGRESLRGRYTVADWADRYADVMDQAADSGNR